MSLEITRPQFSFSTSGMFACHIQSRPVENTGSASAKRRLWRLFDDNSGYLAAHNARNTSRFA